MPSLSDTRARLSAGVGGALPTAPRPPPCAGGAAQARLPTSGRTAPHVRAPSVVAPHGGGEVAAQPRGATARLSWPRPIAIVAGGVGH